MIAPHSFSMLREGLFLDLDRAVDGLKAERLAASTERRIYIPPHLSLLWLKAQPALHLNTPVDDAGLEVCDQPFNQTDVDRAVDGGQFMRARSLRAPVTNIYIAVDALRLDRAAYVIQVD